MERTYIIVGNGIAGLTAAKTIRQHDEDCIIYMIGEESVFPYSRIKLSKGLFSGLEMEKIQLQKQDWYKDNKIKILTDIRVVSIDPKCHQITCDNDEVYKYTKLLLTNGSENRRLPVAGEDLQGVFTLRYLTDARNIVNHVEEFKSIVVIGGGVQGLEMVHQLIEKDKAVTLVERFSGLMPRDLDHKGAKLLEDYMTYKKVQVFTDTEVIKLVGNDEKVRYVVTNKGDIPCDMVIYSIGIQSNIGLAKTGDVSVNTGVIVNDFMETSVEDIYAAGDVAEYRGQVWGLYNIAMTQGKTAGLNMIGQKSAYEHIAPVTILNAFGISLFSMGEIDEKDSITSLTHYTEKPLGYKRIFIEEGKVVGAIVIGDMRASTVLKVAIEKEKDISSIDLEHIDVDEFIAQLKSL